MAVDSKAKGSRAELAARDELRKLTGLPFERTPQSGALSAVHGLKADIYLPNSSNHYAIEVKHYAEDHFTSKYITDKSAQLSEWWEQTVRQGIQTNKNPLLIFKFDRSKFFVAFNDIDMHTLKPSSKWVYTYEGFYIMKLDDFVKGCNPTWV